MLFFNEETEALEMHTAWGQGSLKGEKKNTTQDITENKQYFLSLKDTRRGWPPFLGILVERYPDRCPPHLERLHRGKWTTESDSHYGQGICLKGYPTW